MQYCISVSCDRVRQPQPADRKELNPYTTAAMHSPSGTQCSYSYIRTVYIDISQGFYFIKLWKVSSFHEYVLIIFHGLFSRMQTSAAKISTYTVCVAQDTSLTTHGYSVWLVPAGCSSWYLENYALPMLPINYSFRSHYHRRSFKQNYFTTKLPLKSILFLWLYPIQT